MSLITAKNVSKSFGYEDIFSNVSFSIPDKTLIGFVGSNGSGKTTLLRILVGLDSSDSGSIMRAKNVKIGYLPQQIQTEFINSAWDECINCFKEQNYLFHKLRSLESEMETKSKNEALIEEYGRTLEFFEHSGGYEVEAKVKQVLNGLGLDQGEEFKPWHQLSGGQKTRAYLAKLLLEKPDLLILDEPTNHLDIAAVEWLESFLKDFPGSAVIVSHDRYFLDQTVSDIWELSPVFETYRGNYSSYLMQRSERYERQLAEYERQQSFIEKEEDYIRRNIAGQNTRQAQGRRKRLETLIGESLITKPSETNAIRFRMKSALRSGDLVLRTQQLKIGYHDDKKVLFFVPDLSLIRSECAAVIGPNGAGKSTLIKTILGQLEPLDGIVKLGANLKIGYFAQAHEGLHQDFTLMEEINFFAPTLLPAEIRNYLARFLFSGDDVFKKVEVLSGGEKGRLALAVLSLQGANFLLLDEPMNHLDIASQEILQNMLKDFAGTIILISHDRYLIDALGTQIWDVSGDQTEMIIYPGTYSQYKEEKKLKADSLTDGKMKSSNVPKNAEYEAKKKSKNETRKMQIQRENLENEIKSTEKEAETISDQMMMDGIELDVLIKLNEQYATLQNKISVYYEQWLQIETDLDCRITIHILQSRKKKEETTQK